MSSIIHYGLEQFAAVMHSTYEPGEDDPWWADNLAHFISGAAIGLASRWLLGVGYLGAAVVFLALAVVWEWYEYHYDIRPWDDRDGWGRDRAIEDTLLDTYVGLTGTLFAIWFILL